MSCQLRISERPQRKEFCDGHILHRQEDGKKVGGGGGQI